MKKLLLAILILLTCFGVGALEWKPANQITLEWGPVTKNADGTDIDLAKFAIAYNVYSAQFGNKTSAILLDTVATTEKAIQFSSEGAWIFGISSKKTFKDDTTIFKESDISWSDNSEVTADGAEFGAVYIKLSETLKNLMMQ